MEVNTTPAPETPSSVTEAVMKGTYVSVIMEIYR